MQQLTFTTRLKSNGIPEDYSVDGSITHDGETFPVGLCTTDFNRAFNELIHWLHTLGSTGSDSALNVLFETIQGE